MVVRAKVCELTDVFLWFVCGLYEGIMTSPLRFISENIILKFENNCQIHDVTNRWSPFSQQSSQDVLRNSMYIFPQKKKIFSQEILHTPN